MKSIKHDINLDNAMRREYCRNNIFYWVGRYVKIEDRDAVGDEGIVIPFKLWEAQNNVLSKFLTDRLVQVLKANQLGLTWLILAYATWRLLFNPGYLVLGISETELKAKELIRRIDFILRHLPDWMITKKRNSPMTWYEDTALTITIHHPRKDGKEQEDSVIQAFPSSQTAGASFTANLFLFDEWALQQWAHEIWSYAFPTINRPTGGQVIGISTIELGTLFTEIWENAFNGFTKIFLNWRSDPRRNDDWYKKTIDVYGIDETRKHYPSTVEEAFSIPGGRFFSEFSSDVHLKPVENIPEWYTRYASMDYGTDCFACYWYYIDAYGYARIYREVHLPDLVISRAAYEFHKASGAQVPERVEEWDALDVEEKQRISNTAREQFNAIYAPVDLFNKSSHTGKSGATVWWENGVNLISTNNKLKQGCVAMKEWLHPIQVKDEQTGEIFTTAKLTINGDKDSNCAPFLVKALLNIQKNKHDAEIFADNPHNLTHSCTGLMAFCTEYNSESLPPEKPQPTRIKDYEMADAEISNRAKM
jgi:hypothetical protein